MLSDETTNADSFANLAKVSIAKDYRTDHGYFSRFANLTKATIAKKLEQTGFANLTKVTIAKEQHDLHSSNLVLLTSQK